MFRKVVLICACAVALIIGMILGNLLACGDGCSFSPEVFSALGGWVGGVGTAIATLVAAVAFRESQLSKDHEIVTSVNNCRIRIKSGGLDASEAYSLPQVVFENTTPYQLSDIRVMAGGKLIRSKGQSDVSGAKRYSSDSVMVVLAPQRSGSEKWPLLSTGVYKPISAKGLNQQQIDLKLKEYLKDVEILLYAEGRRIKITWEKTELVGFGSPNGSLLRREFWIRRR